MAAAMQSHASTPSACNAVSPPATALTVRQQPCGRDACATAPPRANHNQSFSLHRSASASSHTCAAAQQRPHAGSALGSSTAAAAVTMALSGRPVAAPCAARRQSRAASVIVARMGGRGGGYGDSPLILGPSGAPAGGRGGRGGGPGGAPGRLILPGGPGQFSSGGPGRQQRPVGLDEPGDGPLATAPNKYRPPPGFMNEGATDPEMVAADPQEMLSRLRSRAGQWHALSKLLPVLYAKGFDTNMVAEVTGLHPVDQNRWVVAGAVYESIAAGGEVPEAVLSFFDHGGDERLYHFRFLPAERRAAAALYIESNQLDEQACEVLARAMKEWERRPGERGGFSDSPADCMAFKYLRDAAECRLRDEKAEKLAAALAAAETELARERLLEWQAAELAAPEEASGAGSRAMLQVLRLSQDELGFRPLPLISNFEAASPEELAGAPSTSQTGAFGAFELPPGLPGMRWVALPQWKALALARTPVAVPLADCAAVPAVLLASKAKTEEEVKRLTGAGLLVVDTAVPRNLAFDDNTYYITRGQPGQQQQLGLVDGANAAAAGAGPADVLAVVLFLCRPPNRESAITSAELLQL